MVWIYCFRKRDHTGTYNDIHLNKNYVIIRTYVIYVGTSLELHSPTKDTINPAYHTITDDHSKKPVEEPIGYYEDVNRPPEVKMTNNPAYAVP